MNKCNRIYDPSKQQQKDIFPHIEDEEWNELFKFKPDKVAMAQYLEQGLPALLAMILPANLEVSQVGDYGDGPVYIARQIYVCGTVEDIVQQLSEKMGPAHS